MYAPPWARDGQERPTEAIIAAIERLREERQRVNAVAADDAAETEPLHIDDPNQQELPLTERRNSIDIEAAMADAVRAAWRPSSLDPVRMPAPPPAEGPSWGMVVRLGSAVGFAAVVALIATGAVPLPTIDFLYKQDRSTSAAPMMAPGIGSGERPSGPPIVVADAAPLAQQTMPVIAVAAPTPPLPTPTPTPPALTRAEPPKALPTQILSAYASIDTSAAASPQIAPKPEAVPSVAPPPKPVDLRALERDEIATILRRGQALLAEGDIASARLLLRRAAEAGDAIAALTLAGTYDRAELAKLKVIGVAPDRVQARHWYDKAVEYGSAEAVRRLQQFVQRGD